MKVLLDTNVVIHRENTKATNNAIGLLFYWLDNLHCEKCIHPYSVAELRKFRNENMQELYDAKLSAYTELKTIAPQNPEFVSQLPEPKTENDKIDNQLLCEVYCNRVDLLITEDKGLRQKAKQLQIEDRVLSINDFVSKNTMEHPDLISYKMLAVKKEYFGNVDLSDSFFDTFKDAYYGFEKWFNGKSNEEAYVCRTDEKRIMGFLYIKTENEDENYNDISPVFVPKKRLKIGTFKVETSGFRLGERFIKIIFDNARKRDVDEIYVTLFEDKPELKALEILLEFWGFVRYGTKTSHGKEEAVFVKDMRNFYLERSVVKNFPNMLYNRQKFILPILPKYHTTLLPDSKLNTENEVDFIENHAHSYALEKVYISWAPENNICPGDFLLFYRMGEDGSIKKYSSVLTSLGMVESVTRPKSKDELLKLCKNRSVFTEQDLDYFWNNHSFNLKVLKFVYVASLQKRPTLDFLQQQGIVQVAKGARPFTRITDEQFNMILDESQTIVKFCHE